MNPNLIGIDARSIETNKTGVGRYLWNLLRLWPNYFKKKAILYIRGRNIKDFKEIENTYFEIRSLKTGSNFLFQHFALPKATRKDKISLLFSPGYLLPLPFFYLAPTWCGGYSGKTVVAIHDIIYEARPDLYMSGVTDRIILKYFGKKSAKKADFILTSSKFSKQEIIKHYNVSPEKIRVIYLGAEDNSGKKTADRKANKVLSQLGIRRPFFLFVGSIFNRRFPLKMLGGYEQVLAELPQVDFVILGRDLTNPPLYIDKKINEINSGRGNIKRLDYASDKILSVLYREAEALVWLSEYEGFGLPPLEAMASGTPVISTPFASLPEVIGEAGLWVENPDSTREIADKMILIAKNHQLRDELSRKGLERSEMFRWEKTAKETNEVFDGLLRRN